MTQRTGFTSRIRSRVRSLIGRPLDPLDRMLGKLPLNVAHKTYNTSHPEYDATLVRNFPGRIVNGGAATSNVVFRELVALGTPDEVPTDCWTKVLEDVREEVEALPEAAQVYSRRQFVESTLAEASVAQRAQYVPGWVNVDDALFLYWLVRRLRPRTIVQTGVCNGLSAAFLTMALERNGGPGTLWAIDLPQVLDLSNSAWTCPGQVYGVTIPEGRTSGWLVPDALRDRFHLREGDARVLLPDLLSEVGSVDMFFHDSDHTYDHMMFEFSQVKSRLRPGGLVVADDIAWNASLWEMSDHWRVPAYNFRGSMGVAFC